LSLPRAASASTAIYPLPLHDALPIFVWPTRLRWPGNGVTAKGPLNASCVAAPIRTHHRPQDETARSIAAAWRACRGTETKRGWRSEEHTSELQSREKLVCRLLLEKKK